MRALDEDGDLLWSYDDISRRTGTGALLHPRCLFPRAVSTDGRVLLVAGFGIRHDVYGIGNTVDSSIFALDAASGEFLWQQNGVLLNEGKAIPLADRFLVVDDSGATRVLRAEDGRTLARLRPVEGSDWILPVPGRDELLVVENNRYDRNGPTARVYFRPFGDQPDRQLPVDGRVTDLRVAPDGGTITFATSRDAVQRFAVGGSCCGAPRSPPPRSCAVPRIVKPSWWVRATACCTGWTPRTATRSAPLISTASTSPRPGLLLSATRQPSTCPTTLL